MSALASPDSAALAEAQALQLQLEALRQRVNRLESLLSDADAFAASVAHELRTPLGAMEGFCSLLDGALAEVPPSQGHDARLCASRLRAGLAQMEGLVSALMRLSRASSAPLQAQPVDLGAMAREVIDGLRTRHPGRSCHVTVHDGLIAQGDAALLRQLLENLLGNAWKFSAGSDAVRIEVGRQSPSEGGAFFVRDQGAGFDMALAPRLFQPFERLHGASEFEGTGVGLATVHRIIARHGGRIWASAAPGAGATFFFTLPPPAPRPLP